MAKLLTRNIVYQGVLTASRPSSPLAQKKTILRHQNSVKGEKKRVSLEILNEKPSLKSIRGIEVVNETSLKSPSLKSLGQLSNIMRFIILPCLFSLFQ